MVNWKKAWETWDLRAVILLSLLLQTFLIFSAPLRKRMSTAYITMPMWLAYLLADMIAIYAVGLISKSQLTGEKSGPFAYPDLLAFWAPFLLVHLGGPDTITAFALEDNELWLRHFLNLGVQTWAVLYAFVQSLLYNKRKGLLIPTVLMLIAGLIKYGERTYSLYLASTRRFRESLLKDPDPGPNYAKLMDEYNSKKEARLPTKIEMIAEPKRVSYTEKETEIKPLTDLQVVQEAYRFFETFKGLIADLIFSFRERSQSREFFLERSPKQAFKVVEVELNFFYEILYTKVVVVQSVWGHILRFSSFSLNWAALVLFYLVDKKKNFENFDVGITYTLLLGAIALDIVAFLMVLCSDWTIVSRTKAEFPSWFDKMLQKLVRVNRNRWPEDSGKIMRILHRRWSESISQYNLVDYCLRPRSKWWRITISLFGLTNLLDGLKYVTDVEFTDGLRDFIFEELRTKSEMADDLDTAKEIISARGDWVLRFEDCNELLPWINGVDFDQSLLLWHIATELCIIDDDIKMETYTQRCRAKNTKGGPAENAEGNNDNDYCFWSKQMSDYMLYLLIMQTTLLSTVAGIGQIRFRDTCAEAKKFFRGRRVGNLENENICCPNACCCFGICNCKGDKGQEGYHDEACKRILEVNTVVEPVAVKGDRSKSVLFDACRLAKELKKLEGRKWVIISKVWVELMSYAACRCRAYTHAAQLSKGGQLISLVWLLMAHLGLGDQFQISEGHARAKLIVGK